MLSTMIYKKKNKRMSDFFEDNGAPWYMFLCPSGCGNDKCKCSIEKPNSAGIGYGSVEYTKMARRNFFDFSLKVIGFFILTVVVLSFF